MSQQVIVQGTLKADGTLQLDEKLALPAGRVQVMIQSLPDLPKDDPFWQMMQKIWDGQKARGHIPRTTEQVEAERRQLRQEWEERMLRIERIQIEARKRREQGS